MSIAIVAKVCRKSMRCESARTVRNRNLAVFPGRGCNPILRSRKRAVNRHGLYDENGVVEMT